MRIQVNGTHLYFDVDGAGLVPDGPVMRERPTVVLVHGGPSTDHAIFKPGMSMFAEWAQVIYYDHRGHGRSDLDVPENWNLAQWGADLAGLLDALGIEKPIILGASFGGFVAQAFATQYPDRLSKLALVSTASRTDAVLSEEMFTQLGGPEVGKVARKWLAQEDGADREEYFRMCLPFYSVEDFDFEELGRTIDRPELSEHFFRRGGEWHTFDFSKDLHRIQVPTLVLNGALDPILPRPLVMEMYEALPPELAELHIVENAGHGWTDQRDEWIAVLKQFMFDA